METNKKINYKFATAPVALFSITSGNEFKIITYLINVAYITNNSTVIVSYSYLSQACNINSNITIKRVMNHYTYIIRYNSIGCKNISYS